MIDEIWIRRVWKAIAWDGRKAATVLRERYRREGSAFVHRANVFAAHSELVARFSKVGWSEFAHQTGLGPASIPLVHEDMNKDDRVWSARCFGRNHVK